MQGKVVVGRGQFRCFRLVCTRFLFLELFGQFIKNQVVKLDDIADDDRGDDTAFADALQFAGCNKADDCRCDDIKYIKQDFNIFIPFAGDLADRAVHRFTREHGNAAFELNPNSERQNNAAQSHPKELGKIRVRLNAVNEHAGEVGHITVDKRQNCLNDNFDRFAFLAKQNNLHRNLEQASNIQPPAKG